MSARIASQLNPHTFSTWIKPLRLYRIDRGVMYLLVPQVEFRGFGERYHELILAAAKETDLQATCVCFLTPEEAAASIQPECNSRGGAK